MVTFSPADAPSMLASRRPVSDASSILMVDVRPLFDVTWTSWFVGDAESFSAVLDVAGNFAQELLDEA